MPDIIFLSERGWQGARTCSLELAKQGKHCQVLVKGRPPKEVRNFITQYPNIVNHFIPRQMFFMYAFLFLLFKKITGKISLVLVERPRAVKLAACFPLRTNYCHILEKDSAPFYELKTAQGRTLSLSQLVKQL